MRVIQRTDSVLDVEGSEDEIREAGMADTTILEVGISGTRSGRDANGDRYQVSRRRRGRVRLTRWFSAEPVMIAHVRGYRQRLPAAEAETQSILQRLGRAKARRN